jgi:sporulation protein YlmC with PRC-barrel domain
MAKVYAGNLAGKEIVTVEGTILGNVENMVFDIQTGALIDLVVKPDSELSRQNYREDGKFVLIPFDSVCAVKDYIVVDNSKAIKNLESA